MKRNTFILILVLAAGCSWIGSYFRPRDKVIFPSEEHRLTDTEAAETASAPAPGTAPTRASQPSESSPARPATGTAATEPGVGPATILVPVTAQPPGPVGAGTMPASYRVLGKAEVVSAAMFQVNDRFITLEQVLHPLRQKLQSAAKGADEQKFRQEALALLREEIRNQVENALLSAEADLRLDEQEKKGIDENVLKAVRQAVADEGDGSRSKLDAKLRQEGTTLEDWQEQMRRELTVQFYAARRFGERIALTRQMLLDYYRAHRDEFSQPETVRMQVVAEPFRSFLPTSRPGVESDYFLAGKSAKEQIDKAAAALARGEEFAAVAKAHSRDAMAGNGGVWPPMPRGSFRAAAVEEAAFAQPLGQTSKVIQADDGYYIVKTLALTPPKQQSFEDAQPKIEDALRRDQYRKLTGEYLDKMQTQTTIQAAERFEQTALDAAVKLYVK